MKVIILCRGHSKGQSFMSTKKERKTDPNANVKKNTLGHTMISEKKQPTHKGWIGWVILGGRSFIFEIIQQHIRPGWSSEETQRFSYDSMLAGKVRVSGLHTLTQFWVCIGKTNISLGSRSIDRCLSGVFSVWQLHVPKLSGSDLFEWHSNKYAIVEVRNCCEQSIRNTYSFKQKE